MVAAVAIFRTQLLTEAGALLVEDDPPQHADAAVVLGGDEFGTRILKAAQLVQAGYAPYALVSGPYRLFEHESDATIPFAIRKGYPASFFRPLTHDLDSTRSEAMLLDDYVRKHGARRILLVTSNYHTKRAAKLIRKYAGGIEVIPVAAPDPSFSPSTWWKTRTGQKTFLIEWIKTVATAVGA